MVDLDTLERVVREIIQDYAKQNCVYLELRSTPKALKSTKGDGNTTLKEYIDTVISAMKDGEEEHEGKIKVRYIASINRSAPLDHANEVVDLSLQYKEA